MNQSKFNIEEVTRRLLDCIPPAAIAEADRLGCELYAVGGCIRNPLLGYEVGDIDLAVVGDAPELARRIARALNAGPVTIYARFGTALLHTANRQFEFATARTESYLPDSRQPAEVQPVPIEQDLKRRDFTVNAMALAVNGPRQGGLIDLFNGYSDLQAGILRTPLNPEVTFRDDPLRMLRAVRFAAELGFEIHPDTWLGLKSQLARLRIVAPERIGNEFWKMLEGRNPVRAMQLLIDSGMMAFIIPEVTAMAGVDQVNRHHHKDVLRHSLKVMQNVAAQTSDPAVRLAALLHDVGKPATKRFDGQIGWTFHGHEVVGANLTWRIGRRLRLGREVLEKITRLVRHHMRPINLTSEGVSDSAIRRLMVDLGEALDDQLILCRADITTANPNLVKNYLANFDEMARRMGDVEARDRMRAFQSPVRGEQIMELCGIPPGPLVGALKERVEDAILDGIIPYEYEAAREYLLKIKDEVLNTGLETLSVERRQRSQERRLVTGEFQFP